MESETKDYLNTLKYFPSLDVETVQEMAENYIERELSPSELEEVLSTILYNGSLYLGMEEAVNEAINEAINKAKQVYEQL